jgi:hypothetical protein
VELAMILAAIVAGVLLPGLVGRLFMGSFRSTRHGASAGGFTGSLAELDRITRPSIEHVERMEDESTDEDTSGASPR